jgi:DNA-binding transcriptional ArsR family regulator
MSSDDTDPGVRELRDPKAMRAMAHPVRLQVLEILGEDGPLTATELGERIGESPANTSFHLRTLAKYGFVEEAEGGKGRSRPWREVKGGLLVREEELDGEARRAAVAMTRARRAMLLRRVERWVVERTSYSKRWQKVGFEMEFATRMTADELRKVSRQIGEILEPFKRPAGEVPKAAKPVTIAAWGFRTDAPDAGARRRSAR